MKTQLKKQILNEIKIRQITLKKLKEIGTSDQAQHELIGIICGLRISLQVIENTKQ